MNPPDAWLRTVEANTRPTGPDFRKCPCGVRFWRSPTVPSGFWYARPGSSAWCPTALQPTAGNAPAPSPRCKAVVAGGSMGWRGAPGRGGGTAAPATGPSLRPQGSLSRSLRDGRWPTLDPGASTVPDPAAAPGSRTPLPVQRAAQTTATRSKSLQPSLYGFRGLPYRPSAVSIMARSPPLRWASVRVCADGAAVFQLWYVRGPPAYRARTAPGKSATRKRRGGIWSMNPQTSSGRREENRGRLQNVACLRSRTSP
jgi:hypothetical protein